MTSMKTDLETGATTTEPLLKQEPGLVHRRQHRTRVAVFLTASFLVLVAVICGVGFGVMHWGSSSKDDSSSIGPAGKKSCSSNSDCPARSYCDGTTNFCECSHPYFLGPGQTSDCNVEDQSVQRVALQYLYYNTSGDNWGNKSNWLDPKISMCEWKGVSCSYTAVGGNNEVSTGSVQAIDLSSNNLMGSLPASIADLSTIETLILKDNKLVNPLPMALTGLKQLQYFDLGTNEFSGTLPSFVSMLTSVTTLRLSHNKFDSSIPSALGNNLKELQCLDLSFNQFNGSVPQSFSGLSKLSECNAQNQYNPTQMVGGLLLDHNQLSQADWHGLCGLHSLKHQISFAYNNFNGTVPSCFGQTTNNLDVSYNLFTELPDHWDGGLEFLTASNNKISNFKMLAGLENTLRSLYLQDNIINTTIPAGISEMLSLAYLILGPKSVGSDPNSGNQIISPVPPLPISLTFVNLAYNNLSVPLENLLNSAFKSMIDHPSGRHLDQLDLSGNSLTGTIPEGIFTKISPQLSTLLLNDNQLSGGIPTTFCDLFNQSKQTVLLSTCNLYENPGFTTCPSLCNGKLRSTCYPQGGINEKSCYGDCDKGCLQLQPSRGAVYSHCMTVCPYQCLNTCPARPCFPKAVNSPKPCLGPA